MPPCVPPLLLLLLVVRVSGAADDVSSAVLPGLGQRTLQVAAPAPAAPLSCVAVGGAIVWAVTRGGGVWFRQGVRYRDPNDCI